MATVVAAVPQVVLQLGWPCSKNESSASVCGRFALERSGVVGQQALRGSGTCRVYETGSAVSGAGGSGCHGPGSHVEGILPGSYRVGCKASGSYEPEGGSQAL